MTSTLAQHPAEAWGKREGGGSIQRLYRLNTGAAHVAHAPHKSLGVSRVCSQTKPACVQNGKRFQHRSKQFHMSLLMPQTLCLVDKHYWIFPQIPLAADTQQLGVQQKHADHAVRPVFYFLLIKRLLALLVNILLLPNTFMPKALCTTCPWYHKRFALEWAYRPLCTPTSLWPWAHPLINQYR